MLRLEHLFDRMAGLIARDDPVDHHYALASMFEIMDVAARADLKSDVLKELDRHKQLLLSYRGNPAISEAALDTVIERIDVAFKDLNESPGKAGSTPRRRRVLDLHVVLAKVHAVGARSGATSRGH